MRRITFRNLDAKKKRRSPSPSFALLLIASFYVSRSCYILYVYPSASTAESINRSNSLAEIGRGDASTDNTDSLLYDANGAGKNMARRFQWGDIDLSSPGICGHNKCFFRDASNPSSFGYLLAYTDKAISGLHIGWERAIRIEERYGIDTVYLRDSPPEVLPTSERQLIFATELGEIVRAGKMLHYELNVTEFSSREGRGRGHDHGAEELQATHILSKNTSVANPSTGSFLVQRVKVAPEPNLQWGTNAGRRGVCIKNFRRLADAIDNTAAFSARMNHSINALEDLLNAEDETWMVPDMQVILDSSGRLHHFDLDRYPGMTKCKRRFVEEYHERSKNILTHLMKMKRTFERWPYDEMENRRKGRPPMCDKKLLIMNEKDCAC